MLFNFILIWPSYYFDMSVTDESNYADETCVWRMHTSNYKPDTFDNYVHNVLSQKQIKCIYS